MKKLHLISFLLATTFMVGYPNTTYLSTNLKSADVIQQFPTILEIAASPNPFTVKTTISFESIKEQEITFTVKNLLGKTVYVQKVTVIKGNNTIDFYKNDLNPGMYLYSLQTTQEIISKRLVIK